MSTDPVQIELPEGLHEQIAAIVRSTGKTESEVVRQAITEYCARLSPPTNADDAPCYDLAERSGFLGCDDEGPSDLSVNPDYMDGFGRG